MGEGNKGSIDYYLQIPKGDYSENGDGLFALTVGDRTMSNGTKLWQRKFRVNLGAGCL